MTSTNHTADADTFASVLSALRASRLPVAGLIKSWVGEDVSDDGKIYRVFVRSTGAAVNGLISWTETVA